MTQGLLDDQVAVALETPAVVVDLERTEARIERMAATMRERGVALQLEIVSAGDWSGWEPAS